MRVLSPAVPASPRPEALLTTSPLQAAYGTEPATGAAAAAAARAAPGAEAVTDGTPGRNPAAEAPAPAAESGGAEPSGAFELPVVLPEYPTNEEDAYLCTSVPLPDRPLKLVGISSNSDQRIVHHMLLFGKPPGLGIQQRREGASNSSVLLVLAADSRLADDQPVCSCS